VFGLAKQSPELGESWEGSQTTNGAGGSQNKFYVYEWDEGSRLPNGARITNRDDDMMDWLVGWNAEVLIEAWKTHRE